MSKLAAAIMNALETDKLSLPTLPEIALRIRQSENDPNLNNVLLARIIEHDPATSAQLLRIANSPLVRREVKVADLSKAISLLGINYSSKVAISLSTRQLFASKNKESIKRMRDIWQQSIEIACLCYVLASRTKLIPEEAFLAGMLHKIGSLPIIALADENGNYSAEEIDQAITNIHPMLGENILSKWQFPRAIADIPLCYLDHNRYVSCVDLCDLVTIAHNRICPPEEQIPWKEVSALERLGWHHASVDESFYEIKAELAVARQVFDC